MDGRIVGCRTRCADLRGIKSCRLRGFLQFPDLALPSIRFAINVAASDVGVVTVQGRAGIDQHHVARDQSLRVGHPVWVGGRLTKQDNFEG